MTATTDITIETPAEHTGRRPSNEQCEHLAERLVASNGEGCDLLDCYGPELEAGLDLVLASPRAYRPEPMSSTPSKLVGKATTTIHLPALEG
jgi:hypothetical protein